MQVSESHPFEMPFQVENNQLLLGGFQVNQLQAIAGQTPFYAYDMAVINQSINQFRQAMPDRLKLHYAIKANPMPAIVQRIAPWVDGLDVASMHELQVALASGKPAQDISMAGPAKSEADLAAAIASGIVINLESVQQYKQCVEIAKQCNNKLNLAVRVSPDFQLKGAGMKMSGGATPFGIEVPQAIELIKQMQQDGSPCVGLHIFTGSQNLQADAIIEAHQAIFALAQQISEQTQQSFKHINIGGGLGVPYFPKEQALDINPIAQNLELLMGQYHALCEGTDIVMELGRYLVAEAGIYVCEVVDIKTSQDQTFVMTNGGLHHHLAATGNFGQVFRKNYPMIHPQKVVVDEYHEVNVVGPLCTPLDILAKSTKLPTIEVGDKLAILNSGAYGYTASPHLFLSHPKPVEIVV
jgi:diaminopimelate decarboxylase